MAGTVPILVRVNIKARVCKSETLGLLRCSPNKARYDQFLHDQLWERALDGGKLSESIGSKIPAPSGQNDTMEEVK